MDLIAGAALFGAGIAARGAYEHLRTANISPRGLPGSLPWACYVAPGIIALKDGSLLRGFTYRGPDTSSATNAELANLAVTVSSALHPFVDDWMFHFDAVRHRSYEYPRGGAFPDAVSRLIDEERRRAYARSGEKFETYNVLSVTYRPPPDSIARARRWFVRGDESATPWNQHLQRFKAGTDRLADRLGGRLELAPMGSDAFLTHLHRCLTGLEHPVLAPPDASHLDWALGSQPFTRGTAPRIGDKHIYAVSVFGFPSETWSGILDHLCAVAAPYRWSTRVIPLSYAAAARILARQRDAWFKSRKGVTSLTQGMLQSGEQTVEQIQDAAVFENREARQAASRLSDVISGLQTGQERAALYTSTFVIHADSAEEGRETARILMREAHDRGFPARIEGLHACSAFFGTMPGDGWHNLRRPPLPSRNVAHLLPITSAWAGLRHVPSPYFPVASPPLAYVDTGGSTPFRLTLYHKDVGHTLLVGTTGAGKSTFLGFCVAQYLRYEGAQVFWFDKGASAYALTAAMGGNHYDIRPKPDARTGLQFQPFANVDRPEDEVWAMEWTEITVALQGVRPSLEKRQAIQRALRALADRPPEERTIRSFVMYVQDPELRAAMEQYTGTGPYGFLLDGDADGFADGAVHTMEMHRLMEMGDRIVVPTLLHLFRQLEVRLQANRPTLICIDEAWQALLRSDFAGKIDAWLRTVRKQNGAVVLATQNPEDVASSEHYDLLLSKCPTRIFLPNSNAASPGMVELYRQFQLTDREIAAIASGQTKRDYIFKNPDGSRRFEMKLGEIALAFLSAPPGMTQDAAVKRVQQMQRDHGLDWPQVWLAEIGLLDAARDLAAQPRSTEHRHEGNSP